MGAGSARVKIVSSVAATSCLLGSAIAGGWAAYERWWRSCVAEDPLAATCIEAQDNGHIDGLRAAADGLAPLVQAYALQYGLLGAACLLIPFAIGSARGSRILGLATAYGYAAFAAFFVLSRVPEGAVGLFLMAIPMLLVHVLPLPAALVFGWDHVRDRELGHHWPVWLAVVLAAGTPLLDEFFWASLVLGDRSHDTTPWTGATTALASGLAALILARVTVWRWRRIDAHAEEARDVARVGA